MLDQLKFTANKVTCMLDWDNIGGHDRRLKCFKCLLLPEFSVWCGIIIHKGLPVSQWMTIKMVYNVCVKHVVVVSH